MKSKGPSRKRLAAAVPGEQQRTPAQPPPQAPEAESEISQSMDVSSLKGFIRCQFGRDAVFKISDSFLSEIRKSEQDAVQLWRSMKQEGSCTTIRDQLHYIVANGNKLSEPDITSMETFPGPMAVPMTKRLEHQIRNNDYWLTEKSDGLRVLTITEKTAAAVWKTQNGVLRVSDCILLEMTYQSLLKRGLTQSNGNMPLSQAVSMGRSLALNIKSGVEGGLNLVNTANTSEVIRLHRSIGLSITFCIDRTGIAYAWQYPIEFEGYDEVFFDGELIYSMSHNKPLFIAYDLPAYKKSGQGTYTFMCLENMSKRISDISAIITAFDTKITASERSAMPIEIAPKKFWPKQKIQELFNCINPTEEKGMVYSCESLTNSNDGVIFTPESSTLFPYSQGTCNSLLKWKFPEMLTIDWDIHRTGVPNPHQLYCLSYTVKDKNRLGAWYEEHVPFTTTPLRKKAGVGSVPFANAIAECSFINHRGTWTWLITSIRADKKIANSYVTAASVLESIAENITSDVLIKSITSVASPEKPLPVAASVGTVISKRPFCCFLVRTNTTSGESFRKMVLQARCKTSVHTHPRSFSYVPVRECVGFGQSALVEDSSSNLTDLLYLELANRGGCKHWTDTTVCAKYIPEIGRWEILKVCEGRELNDKNLARLTGVIQHLQETCIAGTSNYTFPQTGVMEVKSYSKTDSHYEDKARDEGLDQDRSKLRSFNNWIKTCLIAKGCRTANPEWKPEILNACDPLLDRCLLVLDLCSGRGGDLLKWGRRKPLYYIATDSCLPAVATAAKRYSDGDTSTNNKTNTGMYSCFIVLTNEGKKTKTFCYFSVV